MSMFVGVGDDALVDSLVRLVGSHRKVMSEILQHLAEVEERRIHLRRGHGSMFVYCVKALGFSEDEACRRIDAARMSRKFPTILSMVRDGTVTLSVLGLLSSRITVHNAEELLAGVKGLTVRNAKEWLAARFPVVDVPDSIRKLPCPDAGHAPKACDARSIDENKPTPTEAVPDTNTPVESQPPSTHPLPQLAPPRRAAVDPLSAERFSIKLTVSRQVRDKLELARDLVALRNAKGGLEAVIEMALDALIEEISRKKLGKVRQPKPVNGGPSKRRKNASSRHVPRSARREAVRRSGLQCEHVAPDGTRCTARAFLEFDHINPIALGGGPETDNIRVLCKSHNRLAAEDVFGKEHVAAAIQRNRKSD